MSASSFLNGIVSGLFPHLSAKKGAYLSPDGRMHLLEGRRGRGKSYTLTALTKQFVGSHIRVYTNIRSLDYYRMAVQLTSEGRFPSLSIALAWMSRNVIFIRDWDDILQSYGGVLILDEASRLFHSQRGQGVEVPAIVYEWFRQSRHFGMTIFLATQDFNWIDGKVASLVDVFWSVRKINGARNIPVGFWLYGLDSGGAGSYRNIDRRRPDRKAYYPTDPLVFPLYNTHEVVEDVDHKCSYKNMQDIGAYYYEMGYIKPSEPEAFLYASIKRIRTPPADVASIDVPSTDGKLPRYVSREDMLWDLDELTFFGQPQSLSALDAA